MRELTDSEREALKQARIIWLDQLTVVNKSMSESYEAGCTAGLDTAAAQITALTAERDELRAQVERLKEAQAKTFRYLSSTIKHWRTRASGHYCQTYNPGMAQGLNGAAEMLEEYVDEAQNT